TAVVAFTKSFLGAAPVWVAGNLQQRQMLATRLLAGDDVSLGLTERGHGGDLLACDTTAHLDADGYRLHGEKWLINNATRGRWGTVFARTSPAGGPRGFSFFLVDKHAARPGEIVCLPRVRTHGVRG